MLKGNPFMYILRTQLGQEVFLHLLIQASEKMWESNLLHDFRTQLGQGARWRLLIQTITKAVTYGYPSTRQAFFHPSSLPAETGCSAVRPHFCISLLHAESRQMLAHQGTESSEIRYYLQERLCLR